MPIGKIFGSGKGLPKKWLRQVSTPQFCCVVSYKGLVTLLGLGSNLIMADLIKLAGKPGS